MRERKTPLQKLAGDSIGYPSLPRARNEDKEDVYIRYLEGKLGWNKNGARTNTYGSGLVDDGLDGMSISSRLHCPTRFKFNLQSFSGTWTVWNHHWYAKDLMKPIGSTEMRLRSHRIPDPARQRERTQNLALSWLADSIPVGLITKRRRVR